MKPARTPIEERRHLACRPTKRQLGKILVDGNFISPADLERALEEQKKTNELLGEVLVTMGVLDPVDLKAALSMQSSLATLDDAMKTASGARRLLGELLLLAKKISPEQLNSALKEQARTSEKLGQIMVRLGLLSKKELDVVLLFQSQYETGHSTCTPLRLGEILVSTGYITREQLNDALDKQKDSDKQLGEILVEARYARPHHIEHGLKLQNMLLTAALSAVLALSSLSDNANAAGRSSSRSVAANVMVAARVKPRAFVKVLRLPADIVITNSDIKRGYAETTSPLKIEIRNNDNQGYLLAFEGLALPFKEAYVNGLGGEVRIEAGSSWIRQPYAGKTVVYELSFRFILSKDTQPGTYAWPLSVLAIPL